MIFAYLLVALSMTYPFNAIVTQDDTDPDNVLSEAHTLALQGKYEEALQKHLWFHENALKYKPSLSAVRLSFALGYWIELGKKYPKAREALVSIRDKDTKAIKKGSGSFDLFHETSSINHCLEEGSKTVELFKFLHEKYPALAERCYRVAEEELAAQGEYKQCIHYIPDPLQRFDEIREMRELNLKLSEDDPQSRYSMAVRNSTERLFVKETCCLIEILVGVDRKEDAEKVRELALAVRNDPALRGSVEKAESEQQKKKAK